MKFEETTVMNFDGAFRGLRNPMNSWAKSDSAFAMGDLYSVDDAVYKVATAWTQKNFPNLKEDDEEYIREEDKFYTWLLQNGPLAYDPITTDGQYFFIGPNDMDLAQRMIAAGSPNDKFIRQIFVSVDITAPLYFFKEFDTYKVGTVANSTSTMHKLAAFPITKECFEMDDYSNIDLYTEYNNPYGLNGTVEDCWNGIIDICETLRQKYNETKDIRYWKELVRILPNGWLQTRTVTMNYANLRGMYHWRRDHKLTEWHQFCDWIKTLPYANELILYAN